MNECAGHLEGAAHTHLAGDVGYLTGDVLPFEDDPACLGFIQSGDGIEKCGLTGPVGANEADNLTGINLQADIIDGYQAAEFLGNVSGL